MCMDAGDELKEAWQAINKNGGPANNPAAMTKLQTLPTINLAPKGATARNPVPLTWRTAPDIYKNYDRLEYTKEWTLAFRKNYDEAKQLAEAQK